MAKIHILHSLKNSPRDIRLLWWSVFIRMVTFGLTNQFFTLYLKELGIIESNIGLFMSMTLIGDSILSYILTWNSNLIGNKNIMIFGSLLMVLSTFVFSTGTNSFIYLLIAAIFGVISPSGSDTGPFKTIEETSLAHLTPPNHRPEIYAIHWIIGALGSAIGALVGGMVVHYQTNYGLTLKEAYQNGFRLICLLSFVKFISMFFLSYKVEISYTPKYQQQQQQQQQQEEEIAAVVPAVVNATENIVEEQRGQSEQNYGSINTSTDIDQSKTITGLSRETQIKLFKLLLPFMLDSFGYGFMPSAWTIYYFKYHLMATPIIIGLIFSMADLIVAISSLPSAYISKLIGPIKGTILTQIPCAFVLMLIPLLGKNLPLVSTFYLLNQSLTAFDVVPRQIILTTIFKSSELPKILGTVNIGKQIARSISPFFTGVLAEWDHLGICFVINGSFLLLANIILALEFKDLDSHIKLIESDHHNLH